MTWSLPWLGFDLWPGNSCVLRCGQKKKKEIDHEDIEQLLFRSTVKETGNQSREVRLYGRMVTWGFGTKKSPRLKPGRKARWPP